MTRFMARRTLVQMEEHDRIESDFDDAGVEMIRGRGEIVEVLGMAAQAVDQQALAQALAAPVVDQDLEAARQLVLAHLKTLQLLPQLQKHLKLSSNHLY